MVAKGSENNAERMWSDDFTELGRSSGTCCGIFTVWRMCSDVEDNSVFFPSSSSFLFFLFFYSETNNPFPLPFLPTIINVDVTVQLACAVLEGADSREVCFVVRQKWSDAQNRFSFSLSHASSLPSPPIPSSSGLGTTCLFLARRRGRSRGCCVSCHLRCRMTRC